MAPTQPQPLDNAQQMAPSEQQPAVEMQAVTAQQPATNQPMNAAGPHEESEMGLRGGDRGSCCPGRFCFCIPCCLPCDFCII